MKTAGVRELKAHLSSYLREVQRGEVFLVTDNGRVVAELRAPGTAAASVAHVRYPRLTNRGAMHLAPETGPLDPAGEEWAQPPAHPLPRGTAQSLIDAERGE